MTIARHFSLALRFAPLPLTAALLLACQLAPTREQAASPGPGTILNPDYQQVREEASALIRRVMEAYHIQGMSVAVVDDQALAWAEGFGYADVGRRVAATPETVYRVGSIAKPLTALAVMQLDETAQLDVDQPLFAYLPQFNIRSRFNTTAQPITVRSVLSHHSGLPSDLNKGMWSREPFTRVATALGEEYAAYPPDLVFSYSNVGYTLLGHMVQETTGRQFTAHMREAILDPAAMHNTSFSPTPPIQPLLSKGYRGDHEGTLLPIRDLPAYALHSDVLDLSRFMRMMLAGGWTNGTQIVDASTVEEMFEVQNADVPLDLHVRNGLGWFIERDTIMGGGYVVRHGGTTLLFASEMILLPEHHLGVVVLANSSGSRPVVSRLAETVLQLVLDAYEGARPAATALFLAEMPDDPTPADPVTPGGNYVTDLGLIAIRPKDERLCACIADKTLDLIPYPDGWFGVRQESVDSLPPSLRAIGDLRFATRMIDGREVIVAEKNGQEVLLGEKMPRVPVPEVWIRRAGEYDLLNPDEDFPLEEPRVWYEQGTLGMSYRVPLLSDKTIRVPLMPISDTEAVILGLGRMRGETLRAIQVNGEEHLRYSGFVGRQRGN